MIPERLTTTVVSRRKFLEAAMTVPALRYAPRVQTARDRLGASTACLAGLALLDAIKQLERLGFGALEVIAYTGARHSVGDIPGFGFDQASAAERDMVFNAARRFRHISAHLPFQDVRLFSSDGAERRAGLARLQRAIDGLAFLRGEMAVMHLGWPDKGMRFRDIWQPMIDTLRSLGDYAADRTLKLGIETMQPDSVRDYTELIVAADHPSVGAVIDTGHIRGASDIGLPAERRDTDEARARFNDVLNTLVTTAGRTVFHLHLSDVRRSDWADHREIGTGIIDFPRLFTTLRRIAFSGLYVLELEEPDTIGALERSRDYVEALIARWHE
jgi:sugar phosphate isomerase/epimerase